MELKEGMARFVQAAEWRKNGNGKGRGRSIYTIWKQEACPAVLTKPIHLGEGEASRLWEKEEQRRTGLWKNAMSLNHSKSEGP